jgi:uncharacterized membrane protein YqaE (UPF0057 family)
MSKVLWDFGDNRGQWSVDHSVLVSPFLAVLIKKGPCIDVLWDFLSQLLGHIPGVIYAIIKVTED